MKSPLISIITVVYNGEKFLEETIKSVITQTYSNIEYIIIDGGSTDKTIEIIKKYEDKIAYWVSEKDGGIYDAMNKGIDRACGEFVNFMNAGDEFYDKSVLEKLSFMLIDKKVAYFGRAQVISEHSTWLHPSDSIREDEILKWLEKEAPNHQALFFPKSFYKSEKYNLDYTIFADADYKDRMKVQGGFSFVDMIVCRFEFGGVSSGFDSYKHVKTMMREAWVIGKKEDRVFLAIKRIIIYNIKYILKLLVGEKLFLTLLRRYRD